MIETPENSSSSMDIGRQNTSVNSGKKNFLSPKQRFEFTFGEIDEYEANMENVCHCNPVDELVRDCKSTSGARHASTN